MKVLFVCSGNKEFKISPFVSSQGKSIINNGVSVDYYIIKGKGVFGYLKNIPALRKFIKNDNYDVIHSHYTFSGWISLLTFTTRNHVISFMGTDVYGSVDEKGNPLLKGKINYLISKLIQPFVSEIIVKSERLGEYVYLKRKMSVIPNGVDFTKFKPMDKEVSRNEIGLESKKKQVLFLGNKNNSRKNFKLLESAMKLLDKTKYELMPFDYPIKKNLVPLFINSSDVVIMSSYLEGSPNVVKEAMACNVPVVSVDVGDAPEVLSKTKGCYIVDYDANELADKIELSCKIDRTTGRNDIQHLEINNIAKRIINLYKSVLK